LTTAFPTLTVTVELVERRGEDSKPRKADLSQTQLAIDDLFLRHPALKIRLLARGGLTNSTDCDE
jgi:hypothetical protein